ncbi:MAG: hypothetical protein AVDCRST_MAG90-2786, partial [uncultured Microvirga sp.]
RHAGRADGGGRGGRPCNDRGARGGLQPARGPVDALPGHGRELHAGGASGL